MGHLSPEHVTDPQHVMLPSTLPVPGHSGYRLQPHEAPRTLQPTVVTSHHLPFVQHWSIPGEQRAQRGGEGQGRWAGDRQRQREWGEWRKTEKGTEVIRDPEVPQHWSETPHTPLAAPSPEPWLSLFVAFCSEQLPGAAVQAEIRVSPEERLPGNREAGSFVSLWGGERVQKCASRSRWLWRILVTSCPWTN